MGIGSKIIRLKENSTKDSLETARFFLNYKQSKIPEDAKKVSHEILSVLKGDSDVIMEINTNLLFSSPKPGSEIVQNFIEFAKDNSLDYKFRKIPATTNQNIMSKLFAPKKQEAQELIIFIPSPAWHSNSFGSILNLYGTKYHFLDNPAPSILDDLLAMSDPEKLDSCKFIVFDLGLLGNMGINTKKYNLSELKKLLE
jgi:hypothetical protein